MGNHSRYHQYNTQGRTKLQIFLSAAVCLAILTSPEEILQGVDLEQVQVVTMPEPWRFRIDPENLGVKEKWFETGLDDSQWGAMRTDMNVGWESQGFCVNKRSY